MTRTIRKRYFIIFFFYMTWYNGRMLFTFISKADFLLVLLFSMKYYAMLMFVYVFVVIVTLSNKS